MGTLVAQLLIGFGLGGEGDGAVRAHAICTREPAAVAGGRGGPNNLVAAKAAEEAVSRRIAPNGKEPPRAGHEIFVKDGVARCHQLDPVVIVLGVVCRLARRGESDLRSDTAGPARILSTSCSAGGRRRFLNSRPRPLAREYHVSI